MEQDSKVYILKIKPGIYFTNDPAFKGKRRELVAEDYVYTIKRILDPKIERLLFLLLMVSYKVPIRL